MILNNMINYTKNLALLGGASLRKAYIAPPYPIKTYGGTDVGKFCIGSGDDSYYFENTQLFSWEGSAYLTLKTDTTASHGSRYPFIMFGTGTTPATTEDYKLESLITSGISLFASDTSQNISFDEELLEITRKVNITATIKNTSSEDITITEVGLANNVYTNSGYYRESNTCALMLIYREVLETAVTIPAGGYRSFNFEFTFTHTS